MANRLLVIDTATPDLSVALFDGDCLLAAVHERVGRGHAERLLPAIAALPDGGKADAIWVGCGPGSFTGIRIAIAAAKALAFAWGVPLHGFDTLALIVADARQRGLLPVSTPVAVAVEGGHGDWFVSRDGGLPQSMTPLAAAAGLDTAIVLGTRASELVALRGFGKAFDASADARAARSLTDDAFTATVAPFYGRSPDAVPAR
jgi:tRNA threonylcarbamoyladenosine biosynthesis protein TsaB